ncbi:MAG TPA: SPASM domain-containing protein, partial [Desulfatiglandales bacterium]|nr:SPASM domain-containing protein [Desulfatiglandales bacterium]
CPTGNWEGACEHLLTQEEWDEVDRFMIEHPHVRSDWTINFSMRKECPGGREKLCISPYGDVMGCGMNFISLGNVLEEPLEIIWKRTCEWPPFKRRATKCLIAVDEEYLKEYIFPIVGYDTLPVSIFEHPVHPMNLLNIGNR